MNMSFVDILIPVIVVLIIVGCVWFVVAKSKKNQKPNSSGGYVGPGINNYPQVDTDGQEGLVEHEGLFDSDGPQIN